jgi:hypothetical protein
MPGFSVFTRDDGNIRHLYSHEMSATRPTPDRPPVRSEYPLWPTLDWPPDTFRGIEQYQLAV